ncbi:hypothetical protein ABPG74_014524 [Tetrahymena malaccensis]
MKTQKYLKEPQRFLIYDVRQYNNPLYEPASDRKPTLIQNDYDTEIPILIDYGSGITKAGWGNSAKPDLSVQSLLSKSKDSKTSITQALTSSKIKDVDLFKGNYRSPYERNIIQQFGLLENLNDFIFNEIGVVESKVDHPLIITEPVANPEYCRQNLLEQYFECYEIPSVMIGVDTFFATFYEFGQDRYQSETCLIISIGHTTCHIIPMVNGQIIFEEIKRINVGYFNCFEVLYKQLILKNNHQKHHLDYQTVQAIHLNNCSVAVNYDEQLKYLKYGTEGFQNKFYSNPITRENNTLTDLECLQEPIYIDFPIQQKIIDESELLRKQEIRQKQAERLKEAMQKKREEKKRAHEKELAELESLESKFKEDQQSAKMVIEQYFGKGKGIEEVRKRIQKVKVKLGFLPKDTLEEDKYTLINIADSQLTAQQQKQKKLQIIQKQAAETRAEKKALEKQKKEEIIKMKTSNPEVYLNMLYEKRLKIIKKVDEKKKHQQELSTRNSRVNQKRMQTIAQLGASEKIGKDDNFGMNDEDWNIYIGIQRDYESDEENQEMKLNEIEIELREMDPNFDDKIKIGEVNPYGLSMQEPFIELSVDRFRGNEAIFQPGIVGVDQSGLTDVITFVLNKFPAETQAKLLQNIRITGGGSVMQGLAKRIERDLISNFKVGSVVQVNLMQEPIFGAWLGMQKVYKQYGNKLNDYFISKQEYFEKGSSEGIFKSNPFSNVVIPY